MFKKAGLLVSAIICAVSAHAELSPKFDYRKLADSTPLYDSEEPFRFQLGSYQKSTLYGRHNSLVSGDKLVVAYSQHYLSLISLDDNGNIKSLKEYNNGELGQTIKGIVKVVVSSGDKYIYLFDRQYDNGSYKYFIHTFENDSSTLSFKQSTEISLSHSYINIEPSISNDAFILWHQGSNSKFQTFSINSEDGSFSLTGEGSSTLVSSAVGVVYDSKNQRVAFRPSYSHHENRCAYYFSKQDSTYKLVSEVSCSNTRESYTYIDLTEDKLLVGNNNNLYLFNINSNSVTDKVQHTKDQLIDSYHINSAFYYNDSLILRESYDRNAFIKIDLNPDNTIAGRNKYSARDIVDCCIDTMHFLNDGTIFVEMYSDKAASIHFSGSDLSLNNELTLGDEDIDAFVRSNNRLVIDENLELVILDRKVSLVESKPQNDYRAVSQVEIFSLHSHSNSTMKRINDTDVIVFSSNDYYVFRVNKEELSLSLVNQGVTRGANSQYVYLRSDFGVHNIEGDLWVAKVGGDKLAVYLLNEGNEFVFQYYLVDGADDVKGINNIFQAYLIDDNLVAFGNNNSGAVFKILDSKLKQTDYIENHPYLRNHSNRVAINNNLYYLNNWLLNTVTVDDEGKLELLAVTPIHDVQGHSIKLVAFDSVNLGVIDHNKVHVFSLGKNEKINFLKAYNISDLNLPVINNQVSDWSVYSQSMFFRAGDSVYGKLSFNRAPVVESGKDMNITLSEGQEQQWLLSDWVVDFDLDDSISFSEVEMPASMTLVDDSLSFSGEKEASAVLTINAKSTDELESQVFFDITFNNAPVLKSDIDSINVNQGVQSVVELKPMFEDIESHSIHFETGNENLSLSSDGVLQHKFTTFGQQSLSVLVKDELGAQKMVEVPFLVNGSPAVEGSSSFTMTVNETIEIDLAQVFSDPEGDAMSFELMASVNGLSIAGSQLKGVVSSTGDYQIFVNAKDSKGAESQAVLRLKVNAAPGGGGSLGMFCLLGLGMLAGMRQRRLH
ncbi:hypothetical protein [Pleionea sp. CnH1-48]|uniref:hypothetical protein n=1 Tax=Pleionea sp. CnH1-48 TaxID=2954494 RepID=UPI0020980102|nr:hypothetical protein [Pleionea sp. CnH1-48]MCO7227369.1 hypothetical protein [Pleionea sp. CnH1-48]